MKKGDILIIKYQFDILAWIVRKWTHSNWNHVAWVLNDKYLIEAIRPGIVVCHIKKYSNKLFYTVKIKEIKDIDKKDLEKAIKWAKNKISKKPYFQLLTSFILIALGYQGNLPRFTCSGLIAEALSQVGWHFKKNKTPHRITPADINQSKKLRDVKF